MTVPKKTSAPARFAAGTKADWWQSKFDLEQYLHRRGAENVVVTPDADHHRIVCAFRLFGRIIQMQQRLPLASDARMRRKIGYAAASEDQIWQRVEAETRRKWRVMLTRVKMRLDLVFEEEDQAEREAAFRYEFLADTAIPGGGTVEEFMEPQVREAYAKGAPPKMLPGPGRFLLEDTGKEEPI